MVLLSGLALVDLVNIEAAELEQKLGKKKKRKVKTFVLEDLMPKY